MRYIAFFLALAMLLCGCVPAEPPADIAATTLPVYEFTARLCQGTPLTVTRLVTEEVSCLHDYSLNVRQVKAAEAADIIVISGAGLEAFLDGILLDADIIDASEGIPLLTAQAHHDHDHAPEESHSGHHHEEDPHIWLDPNNGRAMVSTICDSLCQRYPQYSEVFQTNAGQLDTELEALTAYGRETLSQLSCRELITFHDGFAYLAQAFDLTILEAVEEESGSEASAKELIHLIEEVEHHALPAIFTEKSGSVSAAGIISRETGCSVLELDMAMSGESYFKAMYRNIDTIKEALQ